MTTQKTLAADMTEARAILAVIAADGPFFEAGLSKLPVRAGVKSYMAAFCAIRGLPCEDGRTFIDMEDLA